MKFDQKKFEELLASDPKEAGKYLSAFLESDSGEKEVFDALFRLETERLKFQNIIDEEYVKKLRELRDDLKEINKLKGEVNDQIKLEETRADLNI